MRLLRSLLAVLAIAIFAASAHASSGTNFSDQWWNPNQSGWGASVLQQGDVLFIELFVYGTDPSPMGAFKPTWYTAALYYQSQLPGAIFKGDLYASSGPWFGGSFDSGLVTRRIVGTITFEATSTDTATLTYTVDGVLVQKAIERLFWTYEDFSGNYYGGLVYDQSGCTNPASNGHVEEFGPFQITQNANNTFTLTLQSNAGTCTFTGNYSQAGHMGNVSGNYACSYGLNGTVNFYELERTGPGMTGRFVAQNNVCNVSGTLGGVER
jgi:hypothetical protein